MFLQPHCRPNFITELVTTKKNPLLWCQPTQTLEEKTTALPITATATDDSDREHNEQNDNEDNDHDSRDR